MNFELNFPKFLKLDRSQLIALISAIIFSFWILLVYNAAPRFQEAVGTDSLAMINVLFPDFWIIIIAFVIICFLAFFKTENSMWLHVLLIAQISLILFVTPFVLSGFSWSPDSLWHGGVARYLPEILSGAEIEFGQYAQSYPFSFITTYIAVNAFGIGILPYTLYIYPILASVLISVLGYFFASRVFGSKIAFLSLLFTLPSWHYIEPHVSPFSAGTILVLVSLIFLTYRGLLASILSLVSISLVVLTHPISPISLGCYILAYILVSFFLKKEEGRSIVSSINSSITVIFMLGVVWFSWTALHAMNNYQGIATALLNIFNFGFLARLLNVSSFTIGGQGFIYPEIHTLSLMIYGLFLAFVLFPFIEYFVFEILGYKKGKIDRILYNKMALSLAAIINAVLGFFLFLSSGERFLLGRGLLYFLFFGSIVFSTYFIKKGQFSKKIKNIVAFSLVIFLFTSFPIAAYSKEAYNSFTPSADAGLVFLTSKVDLSNKNISMGVDQQLATYLDLTERLDDLPFPPNLNETSPQVVVLKLNSYYVISMRYDLSFTNNSYTILEQELYENINYSKIYSNSRFEVYLRTG